MSGTAKGIFAGVAVFLFFLAMFLIGFFDSLSEVIHADEVETNYGAEITSMKEEAKEAHMLFLKTTVYVGTYSVTYEDGSKETFEIESEVPQVRNHRVGEKVTVFKCDDRHAFVRGDLFQHPALRRTGIGIIIFEGAVLLSIVYPRRHRYS